MSVKICRNLVYNHVIIQAYDENGYWRQEFNTWDQKYKIKPNSWLLNLPEADRNHISDLIPKKKVIVNLSKGGSLASKAATLPGYSQPVIHPVTKNKDYLGNTIIALNDVYKWSREQIADWIETLDPVPTFEVK